MIKFSRILLIAFSVLMVGCTSEEINEIYVYHGIELQAETAQFNGSSLRADEPLVDNYVTLDYTCPTEFSVISEIEAIDVPEGIVLECDKLIVGQTSGQIKITVGGTPTVYGDDLPLEFKIKIDDFSWDIATSVSIERSFNFVDPDADAIVISNLKFTNPLVGEGSSDFSEKFILSFDYSGGTEFCMLKLQTISGFLIEDNDQLEALNSFILEDGDHHIELDLGYNFFLSSSDSNYENLTSTQDISFEFMYNGEMLDDIDYTINNIEGFVWDGYTYKVLDKAVVGTTATWLDRNVGATSIDVSVPEVSASGVMSVGSSGFEPNFHSLGSYFQYGRPTGLSLVLEDVVNPIDGSDLPYIKYDGTGWENGSWTTSGSYIGFCDGICWNESADGGTNNPCPPGFRVPTQDEYTTMIKDITGLSSISSANGEVVPKLLGVMNFGFSGMINSSGPSTSGMGTAKGEQGTVGLRGCGTSTSYGEIVPVEDGEIYLATCEWMQQVAGNGNTYGYGYYAKISNLGAVTTTKNMSSNTMVVRCIKHE